MLKRALLLTAFAGLFLYALTNLFLLRFRSGDVYPQYSTLRADPLGSKGFYDGVDELPHLEVRRNFRRIGRLNPAGPTTLIYTGTSHRAIWGDQELRDLEAMVAKGLRVVVAFRPVPLAPTKAELKKEAKADREFDEMMGKRRAKASRAKDTAPDPEPNASDEDAEDLDPALPFRKVAERWGFAFDYLPSVQDEGPLRTAHLRDQSAPVEPSVPWRSALCFKDLSPDWRTLYECLGQPAVIERAYGEGSIALAADSYFLSNEALRAARAPQLLAWLLGSSRTIVFDEESHGITESAGVATLVRRYQLHGLVAGLLLLAGLFVWKNGTRFVPPHAEPHIESGLVRGKDAGEGFINLLRRSIPPAEILETCAAEWKKSFNHEGSDKRAARLDEIVAAEQKRKPRERRPAEAYRAIAAELARK